MFSVFLLVSVFIWLLNALSKNYNSVIEFPLVYSEMPDNKVFVGELPDHLQLNINAHGYALLRYKVFRKPVPINFKVSSFTMNRPGQDDNVAFILTRYVKDQVSRQLPSELQLMEIKPDTLFFHFGNKAERMFPVKPEISYRLDRQFTSVNGIVTDPDSVLVSGPDVILDTMKYVSTETLDLGLLTRNYADQIELEENGALLYKVSSVDFSVELERITEVSLQVPIEVLNLPDTLNMQTFPGQVKVTCTVGLSKFDRMEHHNFRAIVDYASAGTSGNELEVQIQNIPAYLLKYEYYPRSVEFLTSLR